MRVMITSMLRRALPWLIGLVILPCLITVGAEFVLRACGYGKPMRPFVERSHNGEKFLSRNFDFIEDFFPWQIPMHQLEPIEHVIMEKKPSNAYRIFVFGESAAEGWPKPEFSFSRYLKVMFEAQYPEVSFEIYNMAFRGLNSHIMRATADACAKLSPDLYVIYLGNNEVNGPFSPIKTANGEMQPMTPLWMMRMRVELSDIRLFQMGMDIRQKITAYTDMPGIRSQWDDQRCTYWDDPRLPQVFSNYGSNLEAICHAGVEAGAGVVLCTVPVNIRNHKPVNSRHKPGLSKEQLESWDVLYVAGCEKQTLGNYQDALICYQRASEIDDTFAELSFRMGQCFWKLNRCEEARKSYEDALEYDSYLWVRSRKRTNATIKEVWNHLQDPKVNLTDVKGVIESASMCNCPGVDLFYDACHLNMDGNYLFAKAVYENILPMLPERIKSKQSSLAEIPDLKECAKRLAILPFSHRECLAKFLASPEAENEDDLEPLRKQLAAADADKNTLESFRDRVLDTSTKPDYLRIYEYLNQLLLGTMTLDTVDFSEEYAATVLDTAEALYKNFPYHRGSMRLLGKARAQAGQLNEAESILDQTLNMYGDNPILLSDLAGVMLADKRPLDARKTMERIPAGEYTKDDQVYIAVQKLDIVAVLGDCESCVTLLIETAAQDIGNYKRYIRVDNLLSRAVTPDKRVSVWRSVAGKTQDEAMVQFCLGKAYEAAQNKKEALGAFRKAATGQIADTVITANLGIALFTADDPRTALQVFQSLLEKDSDIDYFKDYLIAAYDKIGDTAGAEQAIRDFIIANPADFGMCQKLNEHLAKTNDPATRVAAWKDIVAKAPENARAQYFLGRSLESVQDTAGALDALRKAVVIPVDDAGFNANLGLALLMAGDYPLAATTLRRAIAIAPQEVSFARIPLVEALHKAGDAAGAMSAMEEARAAGVAIPEALVKSVEEGAKSK